MNRRTRIFMLVILLVAAYLRFRALPNEPVGLHYDEAANVILSNQIAGGDYRPLFIRAYTGKEVLFFYSTAPWMAITGGQAWGIRLAAAVIGILTVALSYRAAREITYTHPHSQDIALFTAAWMVINLPHLILSRYGFRAISQPLMQALTVALLWRGLRKQHTGQLIAAGFSLGLTGYTYLAARMFPIPVAIAILVYLIRTPRAALRKTLCHFSTVLFAAVVVFAPLGVFFLQNPETFFTRINQVASTTLTDALNGLWQCLQALVIPGQGDMYVRFNAPGMPMLGIFAVFMGVIGLVVLTFRKASTREAATTKWFLLSAIPVMVLPSALATSEITPSNLRMVGLLPFLMLLPAYGTVTVAGWFKRWSWAQYLPEVILAGVLLLGGIHTGITYQKWATSTELFYAADGEMALAAEALDKAARLPDTTIYIASEHYQHPTVAALAEHYADAKWLTGGATLVLPSQGNALIIVPSSVSPPVSWRGRITEQWNDAYYFDSSGNIALSTYSITEQAIQQLDYRGQIADFAHIVNILDARPLEKCYAGQTCTMQITWQILAPTDAAQLVVWIKHSLTGEWARSEPFHYPPEQWSVGDIVIDQYVLELPAGMPAGNEYILMGGVYNPNTGVAYPRLFDENFGGLESTLICYFTVEPTQQSTSPNACPDKLTEPISVGDLTLVGASHLDNPTLRLGDRLYVTACWQTGSEAPQASRIIWTLEGENGITKQTLHNEGPLSGYPIQDWLPEHIVEDRYMFRIPRNMPDGTYYLTLALDYQHVLNFGTVTLVAPERNFELPDPEIALKEDFGHTVRLLGLDSTPESVTLYWRSIKTMERDYVVFVHVVDNDTGEILSQSDAMPVQNSYPTSLWMRQEVITDHHTVQIPHQNVSLRIGLYYPYDGSYLSIEAQRALEVDLSQ